MNATSKALDRTSTHEARAVFEKLVPIHARDACADLFVDAIATAHSAGPDRWSVTLTAHSFGDRDMWRLNVGLIRVVWIAGKRVIVLVDTAAVSPATLSALRQLGDRSWQDPGEYYAHAPTCKEFAFDPQNISEAQRLFHDGLRSAIAIGSAEPLHHSASKAYSPGIIKALADLTGRDVPYPVGRPEASLLDLSPELTQGGARVDRVFGHLPGVPVGSAFANRQALHHAGVHRPLMSGISGAEEEGADSIVVSGGYEDDEDYGHYIVYTGQGGNDPATRQQVADQTLTRGNLALARSSVEGLPVRVIRGAGGDPMHSPPQGFRYDGLFSVQSYWQDVGKSGFVVYRYRLEGIPGGLPAPGADDPGPVGRVTAVVVRQIRDTEVVRNVKRLHHFRCQICGLQIKTPSGHYAEGAHIRPLGRPHDGSDVSGNVLCLCPNDHVRLDRGVLLLGDDLSVMCGADMQTIGTLRTVASHIIGVENVQYHRAHWKLSPPPSR